jgi:hypothetical protein
MAIAEEGEPELAVRGIEVEIRPAHAPPFAAIVRLLGEHDAGTAREVELPSLGNRGRTNAGARRRAARDASAPLDRWEPLVTGHVHHGAGDR